MLSVYLFCFVFGIIGITLEFKTKGKEISFKKTGLFFSCVASAFLCKKFLFLIFYFKNLNLNYLITVVSLIDPWGCHQIINARFINVFNILSIPCIVTCITFMVFFLNEILLSKQMMVNFVFNILTFQ